MAIMDKTKLIQEIIDLQRKVDRDRRQLDLEMWLRLRLSIGQLKSLFFISNQGTTSLSQLAAALKVTPTNTTGIVDRLLKRGLITRTENPEDRRFLVLRTTANGEQLVNELRQKRKDRMTAILKYLSDDEILVLSQGLRSLVKALSVIDREETKNSRS